MAMLDDTARARSRARVMPVLSHFAATPCASARAIRGT